MYYLIVVFLVVIDQLVKWWVRAAIPLGQSIPFIPYLMDLTYVQNTGAAFSVFSQHTWLLTLISLAGSALLAFLLWKNYFPGWMGKLSLSLVLAGAVGNLIDRVVFGFVTDMFKTTFMDFAVFNVADCCITVGVPLLFLYVWFYVGRDEKKEGETDDAAQLPPDGP